MPHETRVDAGWVDRYADCFWWQATSDFEEEIWIVIDTEGW